MSVQKKNINLNTKEKCKMKKNIGLEYVIDVYRKDYKDCFIWFNNELIEFKRFMDCYKTMDIAKVFTENENYYILEETGIYHIVSTSNPEDDWK
ncbi:hypothetical protein [Clostridium sp.]|uniref:hypothetical protein n=1 Tax=Clostridium sp. TaxID=1506 RepID=UPI0028474221|nr:hypothetical protein [Clostridium sp.]MDR3594235.1 hypothetical protein [Clostridium sp.]